MGKVFTHMTMSLDGFIAQPDDMPGEIFDWYEAGEVSVPSANDDVRFDVDPVSAVVLRELAPWLRQEQAAAAAGQLVEMMCTRQHISERRNFMEAFKALAPKLGCHVRSPSAGAMRAVLETPRLGRDVLGCGEPCQQEAGQIALETRSRSI